MEQKMRFLDMNPFIRYAQFLTITSNRQYVNIAPYDYRLFYCCGGSGIVVVNGRSYEMKMGSAICWPPGFRYSLTLDKTSKHLNLMQVNFDYTRNHCDLCNPVAPSKWNNFDSGRIIERVTFEDFPEFNGPVFVADMQFLNNAMNNLVTEFISKKNFYITRTAGLLKSNLSLIARFLVSAGSISRNEALVNKIIQYIRTHHCEEINNQVLGEYFGYHPNHLNRLLVQHTGMSIHKYLIHCRIEAAIDLIQASDLRTSEIAEAVGFRDNTHFLKYFKKVTGKNTRDYRQ